MMHAINRLQRRVLSLLSWGRSTLVDDTGSAQTIQVKHSDDEISDGRPRIAEYGFSSYPPNDTDLVVAYLGGDRTNGIVIATNNQQYRLKNLQNGDVALYDSRGQKIILGATGISITSLGVVSIVATTVTISGDLSVGGTIS